MCHSLFKEAIYMKWQKKKKKKILDKQERYAVSYIFYQHAKPRLRKHAYSNI